MAICNIAFAFTKSFTQLLFLRLSTGIFNNLTSLSKLLILDFFNIDNDKVLNFYFTIQNYSVVLGLVIGSLTYYNDFLISFNVNKYYISSWTIALINMITLIMNLFKNKLVIPKRRSILSQKIEDDNSIRNGKKDKEEKDFNEEKKINLDIFSSNKNIEINNENKNNNSNLQDKKSFELREDNYESLDINYSKFYSNLIFNESQRNGNLSECKNTERPIKIKKIMKKDSLDSNNPMKTSIEFNDNQKLVSPFKMSILFTLIQVCDVILYNIIFIFIINCNKNKDNILDIAYSMTIFHLPFSILLPILNKFIFEKFKIVRIKQYYTLFLISVLIISNLILILIYSKCTIIEFIMLTLVIRNLLLSFIITVYNIIVIKVCYSEYRDRLNRYHNYMSFIVRSIVGLIICYVSIEFNNQVLYIYAGAGIGNIILTYIIFKLFNLLIKYII